jgi:tyrosine-protein phosphatase YwqE
MVFDFFKSSLPDGFLAGACDMHSHLLPGVDDGFKSFEDSMEGLAKLKAKGFVKAKMTPHFMKDYPENTRETIEQKYQDFLQKAGDDLPMELTLGGEYMLDSHFLNRFEEGFLTLDKMQSLVLCETSYMMRDPMAKDMLYQVMLKGYQPVIAHPERYMYASKPMYKRWKDREYLFQLNLFSLSGVYGKPAEEKARMLLKEGFYDYVGTDLHRVANLESKISSIKLSKKELDRLSVLLENNKKL